MTDELLAALLDAIVPGGALPNGVTAPPGRCVLEKVRADLLAHPATASIDVADPPASLVTLVLSAYYQSPEVVAAFGWPARPPQPAGHALPAFDERLLEPVRRRGPIWREA